MTRARKRGKRRLRVVLVLLLERVMAQRSSTMNAAVLSDKTGLGMCWDGSQKITMVMLSREAHLMMHREQAHSLNPKAVYTVVNKSKKRNRVKQNDQ